MNTETQLELPLRSLPLEEQLEFNFNEPNSLTFGATNALPSIVFMAPSPVISFHNDMELVGKIDMSGGKLTFEGKADSSALIFLSALANNIDTRARQLYWTLATYKGIKNNEGRNLADDEMKRGLWPKNLVE